MAAGTATSPFTSRCRRRISDVPPESGLVPLWPWELAHADGTSLARQDVTVVYDVTPPPSGSAAPAASPRPPTMPVGEGRRMLAVFSQPSASGALALRWERHALAGQIRTLGARHGRRVELRVPQYWVTRPTLKVVVRMRPSTNAPQMHFTNGKCSYWI